MPVIVDAEYLSDYKIKLTFDNGEKRIADCWKWLNGEVFEPLKFVGQNKPLGVSGGKG